MAISEVILVIPDVDLDNFLKFNKKNAKHILKKRFVEQVRLNKRWKMGLDLEKCPNLYRFGKANRVK